MLNAVLPDQADDLELLRAAAVSAGILASGFFRRKVKVWEKENASPVTEADKLVDAYLGQALGAARPDYGWLSEETPDTSARLGVARVFVIDPIDGTRGFIQGDDSWTVSLAVVENGVPVVAVLYAPARDELYEAVKGGGAFLNRKPLRRQAHAQRQPLISAPGAVHKAMEQGGLHHRKGRYLPSLAYRLVQVAAGGLDAVATRRGSQDWDIAAAALILSESGILFEDACTGSLRFNKQDLRHGALAALSDPSLQPVVNDALRLVYGCPGDPGYHS